MHDRDAESITVLVVEDHPVVRDGLAGYIDADPGIQVVGQTGDGLEAVELAQELVPDVVLMDIVLKGSEIQGAEATRRMKNVPPDCDTMLTARDLGINFGDSMPGIFER